MDSQKTGTEIRATSQDLEEKAAALLGQLLFEFSYLERDLGLCVVWVDGGRDLDRLTVQLEQTNLHGRLLFLEQAVDRLLPLGSEQHGGYMDWIEQAHALRKTRNEMVHGRWGTDASRLRVVNVVGLPTSAEQRSVDYGLEDLRQILDQMRSLRERLGEMRSTWPL